jgi:radical SAM superfamily enzyme YgiQ (UPF0313 family)
MRVLLISANTERLNMPTIPLGLACVAAAARRAGHDCFFLDLLQEATPREAVQDRIITFCPDVIGISVRNVDDQNMQNPRFLLEEARTVIEICRVTSSAPIVLGGAGYSLFPDAMLAFLRADYGVAGDGEEAFPALLDCLARQADPGALPGVHAAGISQALEPTFAAVLDALPLPDESVWAALDPSTPDLWIPVQSRRGCPNDCSYCATFRIQGRRVRSRSPRATVEHIARLTALGFQRFYFVDNSFNIPEPHALELCDHLRALQPRVRWRCILYPHRVEEKLVRAMADAGCVEAALGFESGSAQVLTAMNKRFDALEVRGISQLLAMHGIRRIGFLLFGGPGETRESVEESLRFAQSLGLDQLRITIGIRIYPGTPLAQRAAAEGRIAPDDNLLRPRFYLAPGLEPWICERVSPGLMTFAHEKGKAPFSSHVAKTA